MQNVREREKLSGRQTERERNTTRVQPIAYVCVCVCECGQIWTWHWIRRRRRCRRCWSCRAVQLKYNNKNSCEKKPVLIGRLIKLIVSLLYKTIAGLITYMCVCMYSTHLPYIFMWFYAKFNATDSQGRRCCWASILLCCCCCSATAALPVAK